MLGQEFLANTLLGQICYEIAGRNVTFSQDITLLKMDTVNMDLMVFDMSKYSETDILPLPSDMEQQLLDDLYKMFAPIQAEPATVSNYPVISQKQ